MKLILADPNTVITLFRLNLIKKILTTSYEIWTCPFLLRKLNQNQEIYLQKHVDLGDLNLIEVNPYEHYKKFKQLDYCECNTIGYAIKNSSAIVLSNEGIIFKICKMHSLTIWNTQHLSDT